MLKRHNYCPKAIRLNFPCWKCSQVSCFGLNRSTSTGFAVEVSWNLLAEGSNYAIHVIVALRLCLWADRRTALKSLPALRSMRVTGMVPLHVLPTTYQDGGLSLETAFDDCFRYLQCMCSLLTSVSPLFSCLLLATFVVWTVSWTRLHTPQTSTGKGDNAGRGKHVMFLHTVHCVVLCVLWILWPKILIWGQ